MNSPSSGEVTPTSPNALAHFQTGPSATTPTAATSNDLNCNEGTGITAAQLSSAYQMFMPNQFHLAAAAAAQQQQQQHQQHQNNEPPPSCSSAQLQGVNTLTPSSSSSPNATTHMNIAQNSNTNDLSKSSLNNNNSPLPSNTNSSNTTSLNNPNTETTNSTNSNTINNENRISPNLNT